MASQLTINYEIFLITISILCDSCDKKTGLPLLLILYNDEGYIWAHPNGNSLKSWCQEQSSLTPDFWIFSQQQIAI